MPRKATGDDGHPVRVKKTLAERVKKVADHRGISISDYLSPMIEDQVNADYAQYLKEIASQTAKELSQIEKEKKGKR